MSSDTRTVEMRFDNRDFESNAKQSISTLEKLKSALKLDGASRGLSEIEKASKKVDFREVDRGLEGLGHKFSWLEQIGIGALRHIGEQAVNAGERIVKSLTIDQLTSGWSKYEEKTTAVQTIMANIRDETGRFVDEAAKMDYVNEQIEKLNWFSDETSYSLTDMTGNVGKFIANGQGLEESVTAMQGIATWAAISGQNSQVAARAMYNISQAMGAGSMKIRDWMSIENANMATAGFKELAITVAQNKGKIKECQVTIQNFRESLSGKGTDGWFDKEVMMEVFSTYGEAADKIQAYSIKTGETATDIIRDIRSGNKELADEVGVTADSIGFKALVAAQEAKTLGEALTATGDAVSTKWMQIYELIFGNYLEQKDLWTDLSSGLWDVFAAPLDDLRLIFKEWNKGIDGISGRTDLLSGIADVLNVLFHSYEDDAGVEHTSILDTIKSGISEALGLSDGVETLGKRLWNLTHRFKEWTASLEPSPKTLEKIKTSVKGLATAFKLIGKTISAVAKPFLNLFGDVFKTASLNLLDMSSGFGEWIANLDALLDKSNFFENVSTKIQNGIDSIKEVINTLFTSLTGKSIGDVFSSIKNSFSGLGSMDVGGGLSNLQSFFTSLGTIFQRIKHSFQDADGPILKIIGAIGKALNKIASFISEASDKGGAFSLAKLAVKGGAVYLLLEFVKSIVGVFRGIRGAGELVENFSDFWWGLYKALKGLQFKLIADGLKSMAVALGIMTLCVALLGSMSTKELVQGMLALVALAGIIALLKGIVQGINIFNGLGAAAAFLAFAAAIGILTLAVYALGNMDTAALGQGIAAIALLTLIFGMFKGLVGTVGGLNLLAAAAAFALFGVAVDILAIGVKILGSMDTKELVKGELAIAGLVLIFGLFRKLTAISTGIDLLAATAAFALFGIAVDILAIGVKLLGSMSSGELARALISVATLVAIFGIFKNFCTTVTGINLIAAAAAFAIFAVAVDILAVGVKALGSMSNRDLTAGVVTIGLLVVIFGLFRKVTSSLAGIDLVLSTAAFAIFAVAIDLIAIGVKALGSMSGNDITAAVIAIGLIVSIFGMFRKLTATALGLDLIGATAAFTLFAIAVDIMAIGVLALGQLDVGQITNGITAVAAMVLLYGVLSSLSAGGFGMEASAVGFLAFSVALIAVAAAMNLLIPVMEAVEGMGEGWWKPLVLLGGALALVVGAGAIAGLPLVSAGLIVLSVALLAIGVAVGIAAAGLALLTFALAEFVEAVALYGPQASANMGSVVNAILTTIITSGPKMTAAAIVLISSFAMGLIGSASILALAAFVLLASLLEAFAVGIPTLTSSIVNLLASALNTIAAVIRASSSLILPAVANILSAIIELVLEVVAGLVELIPGVGESLAGTIRGWKGSVNEALTSVFEDAEQIGSDGASGLIDGFSGGGGGHRFAAAGEEAGNSIIDSAANVLNSQAKPTGEAGGKDLTEGFNTQIDKSAPTTTKSATDFMDIINSVISQGSTDGIDAFNTDFLSNISSSFGDFDIAGLTGDKMSELTSSITSGGSDSSLAFDSVLDTFSSSIDGFDLAGLTGNKMSEMPPAVEGAKGSVRSASQTLADSAAEPISNIDSYGSGVDMGSQYAAGIRSQIAAVSAAAQAMANAVSSFLHFSEPDVGPLSNFHTYAPDMIKLWCSGIYSNLDKVENSSDAMADTVYDGFSTALEYVSDLIDNGMSDELSIRPVMDLSGIQNGIHNMDSLINGANGYTISGSTRLASTAAYGMSTRMPTAAEQAPATVGSGVNNYNTFNITNDDPTAVAQKVSRILDQGARREQAVWAR